MLEGTGARDEICHGDTVARGHGKLEGTGARDEIWHGDTGARMARDLSDSFTTFENSIFCQSSRHNHVL